MEEHESGDQVKESLQISIKSFGSKLVEVKGEVEQTLEGVAQKTQDLDRVRQQLKKKQLEMDTMRQKVRTLNEKFVTAEEAYKNKEAVRTSLMEDIANPKQKQAEIDHQINTARSLKIKRDEIKAKYVESVRLAEKDLDDECDREYESIQKDVENLREIHKKLRDGDLFFKSVESGQAILTVTSQKNAIQRALDEKEEVITDLEENLKQKETTLVELKELSANSEKQRQIEIQSLQHQLEEFKREEQELIQRQNSDGYFVVISTEDEEITINDPAIDEVESNNEVLILKEETTESDDELAALLEQAETVG